MRIILTIVMLVIQTPQEIQENPNGPTLTDHVTKNPDRTSAANKIRPIFPKNPAPLTYANLQLSDERKPAGGTKAK